MIAEFGADLPGTIAQLDYLADLGINAIEVMPVNNVKNTINWGYDPLGYFGVDERFGKRSDFQQLVDAAHTRGIAVLLDVVYGHTASDFVYPYLYSQLPEPNPFNSNPVQFNYGPACDFTQPFTQGLFSDGQCPLAGNLPSGRVPLRQCQRLLGRDIDRPLCLADTGDLPIGAGQSGRTRRPRRLGPFPAAARQP